MAVDLHTHTIHSDGTTTPSENVALAARAGLQGLALTDHDTTAGYAEAEEACARHGLGFIPGIELSTEREWMSVHLLGYWVDPHDEDLRAECLRLRQERSERAAVIVKRLNDLGLPLKFSEVQQIAGGAPVGRPHIAAAMVEAGYVADVPQAFDEYLADGGLVHVPKHAVDPVEGIRLIHNAGGVAVLAHPGVTGRGDLRPLVLELVEAGLVGIETCHAAHTAEQTVFWEDFAARNGLHTTGGSDFHGSRKDMEIGQRTTDIATLDALSACRPPAGMRGVR